ncbi:hypothetical protein ACWDNT_03950 [Streptomyces sp. NPDC000963]
MRRSSTSKPPSDGGGRAGPGRGSAPGAGNPAAAGGPVRRGPRRSPEDPGSQPRKLLRLLAQGYTDEAAARRLGISPRSERRLIPELMEKPGAQSRFQSGRRAVENGYV